MSQNAEHFMESFQCISEANLCNSLSRLFNVPEDLFKIPVHVLNDQVQVIVAKYKRDQKGASRSYAQPVPAVLGQPVPAVLGQPVPAVIGQPVSTGLVEQAQASTSERRAPTLVDAVRTAFDIDLNVGVKFKKDTMMSPLQKMSEVYEGFDKDATLEYWKAMGDQQENVNIIKEYIKVKGLKDTYSEPAVAYVFMVTNLECCRRMVEYHLDKDARDAFVKSKAFKDGVALMPTGWVRPSSMDVTDIAAVMKTVMVAAFE